jgi:hypothetical protein
MTVPILLVGHRELGAFRFAGNYCFGKLRSWCGSGRKSLRVVQLPYKPNSTNEL